MVKFSIRACLSVLALVAPSWAALASDWQNRTIYQLVTDRFAKTVDDGGPCDTGARQYCNGTWQGIINHLDYIQGMGFDAIWISPVVENIGGNTTYGEAYHGYWPLDFNAINSHFGTDADLKALSAALHSRGMYLMLDVIINHVAATSIPPNLTYTGYTPYDDATEYHPFCWIDDYNNQTQVEQCWLGDTNVALPDLDTEDPTVIAGHSAWIQNLVTTYNADGIRIDTAKHVRQSFYADFLKSAGVFSVGEVLDGRANYTGAYTNYIDTVFNYPEWYNMKTSFMNPQANMSALLQSFKDTQTYFKNGAFSTLSFSENHDNARLPSVISDPVLIKNIITWTFAGDGIPTWYYGQEASYSGGDDPYNREALWFTSYSTSVSLYSHAAALNEARKLAFSDKSSTYGSTAASIVASSNSAIAVSKAPMLTVLTNAGNSSNANWNIPSTGYKAGTQLVDMVSTSCNVVTVASDGSIAVTFNAGNPQVYLPTSIINSTGTCGSKAQHTGTSSGAFTATAFNGVIAVVAVAVASFALL